MRSEKTEEMGHVGVDIPPFDLLLSRASWNSQ